MYQYSRTKSYSTYIGVNDRGVLHGAGVPLKSTVNDYSCIDLYAEMVRGDDNVPSTLSSRQDKANARIVFLHYECMVKMEEKQLLANRTEKSTEGQSGYPQKLSLKSISITSSRPASYLPSRHRGCVCTYTSADMYVLMCERQHTLYIVHTHTHTPGQSSRRTP